MCGNPTEHRKNVEIYFIGLRLTPLAFLSRVGIHQLFMPTAHSPRCKTLGAPCALIASLVTRTGHQSALKESRQSRLQSCKFLRFHDSTNKFHSVNLFAAEFDFRTRHHQ